MRSTVRLLAAAVFAVGPAALPAMSAATSAGAFTAPVEYHKPDNGLRVALSRATASHALEAALRAESDPMRGRARRRA